MLKAINVSSLGIENLKNLPDNWVVISISEEHGSEYKFKFEDKNRILRLKFSDIGEIIESKGLTYHPISREQAKEVISFIEKNKEKNFLINCAAGISRSAAICLFLHLYYGYELKDKFWLLSEPNCFILGRLIIEKIKEKNKL